MGAVIDAARSHSDDAKLMQAALLALKQLIANDDAVKVAVAAGILDFLLSVSHRTGAHDIRLQQFTFAPNIPTLGLA